MAVSGNVFYLDDSNAETFTALCTQLKALLSAGDADFENLCASPLIKPCAKYKPEDYNVLFNLTEAQRQENHYGFGKESKVIAKSTTSAPSNTYTYIHPKGGTSSPNRMRDWDNYFHGAILPTNFIFPAKLYVDWVNGIELRVNNVDAKNVTLANVMNASDNLYLALFVYRDSTNQWLFPTNFKVKDLTASYFPTILIAQNSTMISQSGAQPTEYVYPYVLSDIVAGRSYTAIVVGVEGATYQSDMLPMAISEYGNMYSTDIDNNDGGGHDRKAYTAEAAKTIVGLTGSFSLTTAGSMVRDGTAGGYNAYRYTGPVGKLTLTTPAEWLWTSLDQVRVEVTVSNGQGLIYSGDLATNYGASVVAYDAMVTLDAASTTFTIANVFNTIGNYRFNDYAPGYSSMAIGVSIKVYNPNDATQVVTIVNYQSYNISRA